MRIVSLAALWGEQNYQANDHVSEDQADEYDQCRDAEY
jgi:hypothetical protein